MPWLQPYPDRLLDELADPAEGPDAVVVARETIELAYLAVIQLLPARQRAVLLLRDVLEWSAAETAEALELSVAAANSALQRARATVQQHSTERLTEAASAPSEDERTLLQAFIDHTRAETSRARSRSCATTSEPMPPHPYLYEGRAAIVPLMERAFQDESTATGVSSRVGNRQPAAIIYVRRPGDSRYRAFKIDVLRVEDGLIREIRRSAPGYSRLRSAGDPRGRVVAEARRAG